MAAVQVYQYPDMEVRNKGTKDGGILIGVAKNIQQLKELVGTLCWPFNYFRDDEVLTAEEAVQMLGGRLDNLDEFRNIPHVRKNKLATGLFTFWDLDGISQNMANPNADLIMLRKNEWKKVGNKWFLVKRSGVDVNSSYVQIVIRENRSFLNWLFLLAAALKDQGRCVRKYRKIPGTNLIVLDVAYTSDSQTTAVLGEANRDK